MGTVARFEDLEVWKIARRLSEKIYSISKEESFAKDFRFKSQIRAAAGSVMDNIAEGFERSSKLEFVNFLSIAKGSTGEVRSQLYRAYDQKYLSESELSQLIIEYNILAAKLANFINYLNRTHLKGQKFRDRVT